MEKVLIVSIGKYPNGNAGAIRQHAFAKLFEKCGYSTVVIGMGESTEFKFRKFDGGCFTSFRAKNNSLLNRISNLLFYKSKLKKLLENNKGFSKILVVSIPPNALFYLKKYAKKRGIQLLHDSVEWYSPEEFLLGSFSPSYIINNKYNTSWIDNNFKVIAISKYLEDYFITRKCSTIRIPAILDVENISFKKRTNPEKITIVYAGSPGKKDYLKEVIEGISILDDELLERLELRIIGATEEEVKHTSNLPDSLLQPLQNILKFMGRVSREEVFKNLEEADFTILIRPENKRYAKAGFPTKIAESLASATPVICNLTSDLGEYILDGENGIIVNDCSSDSVSIAVKKAIELPSDRLNEMYKNARKCAESYFDYRLYQDVLVDILLDKEEGYEH
jgi:glycosyltransferase involved in cell wall biosynthesis